MFRPIYVPSGKAKEYGDYALNIYTGCPHRCYYCFAPNVRRIDREQFHSAVEPRNNIVEETRKQLDREKITGKLIHLCFTCDPFPMGYDCTPTLEIIKLLKEHGNHVQILTKSDNLKAYELLDENDWYGITLTGNQEPNAAAQKGRLLALAFMRNKGVKSWVSFEPVLNADYVLSCIAAHGLIFDRVKIGKLNYHPSDIDWNKFGHEVELRCRQLGIDYYIKEDLRKEMEA